MYPRKEATMPGKNKPKRLHRHRSVRVARRKRKINDRITGNKRNRNPRPKKTGTTTETTESKEAPSKEGKKVKEVKKTEVAEVAKKE